MLYLPFRIACRVVSRRVAASLGSPPANCYPRSLDVLTASECSQSIVAFGTLWGLVACHSYGPHGMRVSFPVRQMLRLLSQSISRNIERLSYAQRLHTRKLVRIRLGSVSCLAFEASPLLIFLFSNPSPCSLSWLRLMSDNVGME